MRRALLLLTLVLAVATSPRPFAQTAMSVDTPAAGATAVQPFSMAGWAIDLASTSDAGIDYVHVWAFPNPGSGQDPIFFGAAELGGSRPDVAAVYGSQFANAGFGLSVAGRAPGVYELVVYAHGAISGVTDERHVTVTIAANPAMSVDVPVQGADVLQPFTVGGWAIDRAAATGTGVDAVHVWAYPTPGSGADPIFIGAAALGGERPDVGAVFGSQFTPSGYNVTFSGQPSGVYQIVVYARSTLTGTFNQAQALTVTVDPTVAAPTFSLAPGTYTTTQSVVISTSTSNATVRYTVDGSEPTEASAIVSGAVGITVSQTIKAKAFRAGWLASATATAVYTLQVVAPTVSVAPGTYEIGQTVAFSVTDTYATLHYTTNGEDPTEGSTAIGNGQTIALNEPATMLARAFRTGFVPSPAVGGVYTLRLPTPTLSPTGGEFSSAPIVTMVTSPSVTGVAYRYTLNGDEPSASSQTTAGTLSVPLNSTLNVVAHKDGWADSESVAGVYVSDVPPPVSAGSISPTSVAAAGFVPTNSLATFSLTGASLTNDVNDVLVFRADTALPVSLVNSSTFAVGGLIDGRNDLEISGIDAEGLPFDGYATVWAGGRTVSVTTVNALGAPLPGVAVVGTLDEDGAIAANAVSGGNGVGLLTSTPTSFGLQVEGGADRYRLARATVAPDATSATLVLEDENNDFSRGFAGWSTTASDVRLVPHTEAFPGWAPCPECIIRPNGAAGNGLSTTGCRTFFTDDPIVPGVTPIRAVHIAELREAVNCVREHQGLAPFSWTDPGFTIGATGLRAAYVSELRAALSEAYVAAGFPAPVYTDPTLVGVTIKAVHLMELREFVLPHNDAAVAGVSGGGDADLMVTNKNAVGWQTVTRRFHVLEGTSTISLRYRFASFEVFMGCRMNDAFQVKLRNVSTGAQVQDAQWVLGLINEWQPDGATSWRTLSLQMHDNEEVEVSIAVMNTTDLAGVSLVMADVVQEARVDITAFELYDDNLDFAGTAYERLDHSLSVSNWLGNPNTIKLNGRLSLKSPTSTILQSVTLEVIEGGQVKTSTALSGAGAGILGQNLVNGISLGTALSPVKPLFEFLPNQLASSVNQTTNGEVELRLRVTGAGGLSSAIVLPRKINKLTWYAPGNRYGRSDPVEGNDRELGRCYPPIGNPPFICRGDSWTLLSTAQKASTVPNLVYGDFSNMNGGYFPPHHSHRDGRDTDTMWGPISNFDVTKASAEKMIALFQSSANDLISLVYVTMVPSGADSFWKTIRNATDRNGQRLIPEDAATEFEVQKPLIEARADLNRAQKDKEIRKLKVFKDQRVRIRWDTGHTDHFHIRWIE